MKPGVKFKCLLYYNLCFNLNFGGITVKTKSDLTVF